MALTPLGLTLFPSGGGPPACLQPGLGRAMLHPPLPCFHALELHMPPRGAQAPRAAPLLQQHLSISLGSAHVPPGHPLEPS